MQPDPKKEDSKKSEVVTGETKVLIKMLTKVRYPMKKGGKTEVITIPVDQIVKCDPKVAKEFIDDKLAVDFDPDELKVLEI